jgi:hypothetical protein
MMLEMLLENINVRKLLGTILLLVTLLALVACGRGNRDVEATAVPAAPESSATAAPPAAPAVVTAASTEVVSSVQATPPPVEPTAVPQTAQAGATGGDASSGDALALVTNAMAAQVAGGPYRATTEVNSEGTVTEMISEVVPPDKIHVTIGGGNMEIILFEGTVWSRTAGAPWAQMGSPEMMQGIFDTINGQINDTTLTNVQYVGSEPVFGVQTDIYTFTNTLPDSDITSDVKLWISQESGLPVRLESTNVAGGVTSTVVQTIEYDSSITVEAPVE